VDLTTVTAPRLRVPTWRDPRLLAGVLLVLLSVLLGTWAVGSADRTRPVWAAATTLTPGQAVHEGALTVVRASVDGGLAGYLPADEALAPDLVALRTVAPGELVPRSAVGDAGALERRPLGLPVEAALPVGLVAGSQVDVWVSTPVDPGSPERRAPERLAAAAEVAEVSAGAGPFGPSSGTTVQVLLGERELRAGLAALAAEADVALVLVPGSTPVGG
jgi:hypothetical protein